MSKPAIQERAREQLRKHALVSACLFTCFAATSIEALRAVTSAGNILRGMNPGPALPPRFWRYYHRRYNIKIGHLSFRRMADEVTALHSHE